MAAWQIDGWNPKALVPLVPLLILDRQLHVHILDVRETKTRFSRRMTQLHGTLCQVLLLAIAVCVVRLCAVILHHADPREKATVGLIGERIEYDAETVPSIHGAKHGTWLCTSRSEPHRKAITTRRGRLALHHEFGRNLEVVRLDRQARPQPSCLVPTILCQHDISVCIDNSVPTIVPIIVLERRVDVRREE